MEREKQKIIVQENREKKAYQDSKDRFKREELMKGIGQTVVDVKQEQLHQQQKETQVLQDKNQTTKNDKNQQQHNKHHPQNNLPIEHRNHHAKKNTVQSAVQQSAHEMAAKKTMSMTASEIKKLKFRFRSIIR